MAGKLSNLGLNQGAIFAIENKFSHISADKARSTFLFRVSNWDECNPQFFGSFNLHKYANTQV